MLKVDHIAKSEVYIKMQSLTNMWISLAYLYIYIIYKWMGKRSGTQLGHSLNKCMAAHASSVPPVPPE